MLKIFNKIKNKNKKIQVLKEEVEIYKKFLNEIIDNIEPNEIEVVITNPKFDYEPKVIAFDKKRIPDATYVPTQRVIVPIKESTQCYMKKRLRQIREMIKYDKDDEELINYHRVLKENEILNNGYDKAREFLVDNTINLGKDYLELNANAKELIDLLDKHQYVLFKREEEEEWKKQLKRRIKKERK